MTTRYHAYVYPAPRKSILSIAMNEHGELCR